MVPAGNCGDTTYAFLDSSRKRDYSDHEIIVVDSSIDGTDKFQSKYDDKVIRSTRQRLKSARKHRGQKIDRQALECN